MSPRTIVLALVLIGCSSPIPPTPSPAASVASIAFSADSLAGDSLPILAGDTVRIAAKALDASGKPVSGITLIWSSSDTTVATVSSTGLVTAENLGDADISVTVGSASHKVGAKIHATLLISPTNASVDVGGIVAFTAIAVNAKVIQQWGPVTTTWASSNPQVATISSASGQATGVTPGPTLIGGTATVKGKRISASVPLVVTNCASIKTVGSWDATISVQYNAGPVAGPSGTGTTYTATQGSIAKGTLEFHSDTDWVATVTGVANVANILVGPKGVTVRETAANQPLIPEASLGLTVYTDGPKCTYQLQYMDFTQWQVTDLGTQTGPLGITDVTLNVPPPTQDSGWVLSGNVSVPATTVLLTYGPGQYEPVTGIGSTIAMLYPGNTTATVSYRIVQH